ncbi:hypothetical protein EVAR_58887_1 [Eumeta japonica]|uniref:Uncharacterized protein n=1 Tax=Eumeta variegata TaxID=151549 RepID=A0A4C1ZC53_EUMVA|nr:hypothetical protein EVAR_58887_1 [Eumeta japonica]
MLMTYFYTFLTLPSSMLPPYCPSPCRLCSCIFTPSNWSSSPLKVKENGAGCVCYPGGRRPSVDLHFRSTIANGWLGWHAIFTDASKLSEAECIGVGTFHSQYDIVQKVRCPPKARCLQANVVPFWNPSNGSSEKKYKQALKISEIADYLQDLEDCSEEDLNDIEVAILPPDEVDEVTDIEEDPDDDMGVIPVSDVAGQVEFSCTIDNVDEDHPTES